MTGVPLDAWQLGPWNRWAYVNVREVVPTVVVSRGTGAATPLEPADADLGAALDDVMETAFVDGLAVVHDGALLLERYGGEMGPESLHLSQSVGKSVLGLTSGVLAADGRIDPAAGVTDYVPEVRGSGYDGATLQHLLDMTAAIDFVEDYANFWRYDAACGWHPSGDGVPETIMDFLTTIGPASHAHGERFHYATPNTDLLGLAVERAAGAPLADVISAELWAPLGAEADAELTVDPAGAGAIGGGFCATLRDYARLGALVCDGGCGVVPAAWIDALGVGDASAFARCMTPEDTAGADGYRDQWWHRDGGVLARGIHGQLIAVDREARLVVAILSSWPEATDRALEAAHRELVARVRDRVAR